MINRRDFIKTNVITSIGIATSSYVFAQSVIPKGLRIGIIGLDTSHCIAFTKAFNNPNAGTEFGGYKVVAAYPTSGSKDLPASIDRLAGFTDQVRQQGVEIVDSIDELLKKVDVVLLETVDGRKHLEQALPVLKARKPMFIDKPISASLSDAMIIFDAASYYKTPVFSTSSLRYINGIDEIKNKEVGKIIGADTYSPAKIEKTHSDLFWYAIHGIEILFAAMGTGCISVTRHYSSDTDFLVGKWDDNRIGTYRGIRYGKASYGGRVFSDNEIKILGDYNGYNPLLINIVQFFKTGKIPVQPEETLEILAFMEAAEESKDKEGKPISIEKVMGKGRNVSKKFKF